MFDVGFWELCLVGMISLLVIGPEKLPKAVQVAGFWVGKAKTMVASVKAEIAEELQTEEMHQLLKEQVDADAIKDLLDDSSTAVNELTASLKHSEKSENKQN